MFIILDDSELKSWENKIKENAQHEYGIITAGIYVFDDSDNYFIYLNYVKDYTGKE